MSRAPARRIALLALVACSGCGRGASAGDPLEVVGPVPDAAFSDQTGARLRTSDLAGRVLVANFIFTRCPTVCPVTSLKMKRVGERLADEAGVGLVSISVDPEHDTPEVLRAYMQKYGADPGRWTFLTGDPEAIKATVVGGLKTAMGRGDDSDDLNAIFHGTHFVLVDDRGQIRGYYRSEDPEAVAALS
ncbi:MAG TPA: SCO family protein, partial [Kofleriaceae bacterium]|nr:SCO family protein [Kofleriaceae bacterium]